jgi:energy-coupling factor transporter transmembrane protein EcfT
MKILHKITPFLILRILSIILGIYYFTIETNNEGWGIYVVFVLCLFVTICFIIELLLKLIIKNWKKLILFESGLILLVIGWLMYQSREFIFELPENFSQEYITVIYNIDNEQELVINNFAFWKKIQVPKDGIVLTSSKISKDLRNIDFKTFKGEYYNSRNNDKMFMKVMDSEFELNGLKYKFRTWKLGNGKFMVNSSKDDDYIKESIEIFKKKASR